MFPNPFVFIFITGSHIIGMCIIVGMVIIAHMLFKFMKGE
jgi:hypothetical protein